MRIGIIGLGLIGGSLAKELSYLGHLVYASDLDRSAVASTMREGVIVGEIETAIDKIDILIASVYSGDTIMAIERYLPRMAKGAIVIDTAGNKRNIVRRMEFLSKAMPDINFVGGHPMAGRELSGYTSSRQGMFLGARVLIVPVSITNRAMETLTSVFRELGAILITTTATEHDRNIAYTSQLAHILSNAYIKSPTAMNYLDFSAGSFRDLTRVAGMNTNMWTELMSENADNLIAEIDIYLSNIIDIREALASGDKARLAELIEQGNKIKQQLDLKQLKL